MNELDIKQAKRFILSRERKIKNKHEKRTFYCSKHKIFHRYLYKNKVSKTYIKCLKNELNPKFKDDFTNQELFLMSFRNNWNQDKANYYK